MNASIAQEEGHSRVSGCLENICYDRQDVAVGATHALLEWAKSHGVLDVV